MAACSSEPCLQPSWSSSPAPPPRPLAARSLGRTAARRGLAERGRAAARRTRRPHRPRGHPALLEVARRIRHLRGDERREAIALLSRPTDPDAPADERYTVAEEPPLCDANFCVHWVASTADAATALQAARVPRRGERGAQLRERDARLARAARRRRWPDRHLPQGPRGAAPVRLRGHGPRAGRSCTAALLSRDRQRLRPAPVRRRGRARVAAGHSRPRVRPRPPVRLRRAGRRLALRVERRLDGAADVSRDHRLASVLERPGHRRGLARAHRAARSPTSSSTQTPRTRPTRGRRSPMATSCGTTS